MPITTGVIISISEFLFCHLATASCCFVFKLAFAAAAFFLVIDFFSIELIRLTVGGFFGFGAIFGLVFSCFIIFKTDVANGVVVPMGFVILVFCFIISLFLITVFAAAVKGLSLVLFTSIISSCLGFTSIVGFSLFVNLIGF